MDSTTIESYIRLADEKMYKNKKSNRYNISGVLCRENLRAD